MTSDELEHEARLPVCLSAQLLVCLSCLSVCLSMLSVPLPIYAVCLVCPYICLSACLSVRAHVERQRETKSK